MRRIFLIVFAIVLLISRGAESSELTFRFINPSFGGDAIYGGFLLQQAQLQNKFKDTSRSLFQPKSILERFTESFTNQLLYRMANLIINQIFGDDNQLPDKPATYTIGNFKIFFNPENDKYTFEITDLSTGQTTVLEVPRFI